MDRYLHSSIARLTVLLALAGAEAALAQGVTGSAVTGTIKGEGGGPLEGAFLQLHNPATGDAFTAVSGKSGEYFLDNVPPGGPYTLTVSAVGYEEVSTQIQLTLGQRFTLDLVMVPTGQQEVIETHLDILEDRSRTGPSTTLKGSQINEMPLQGRNFTDLISTSPQVNGNSIGGQNNRFNNIQIDGGANNDLFGLAANGTPGGVSNAKPLSIEAIQEFVVQVAPFDVRQSNFTGGLVNAITKSGTNDFHASLFGYYQNKSLAGFRDDPTFFGYNTWQYGGTVSGPIIKDKVHFFVAVDVQARQSAFGNRFQIGGVDPAADFARAGFTNDTAQQFINILRDKYNITNPGSALGTDLGNPDRNIFVKVSTSLIENSHLELSYNNVNARQDELIRDPTPASTSLPANLRGGYQLSNAGDSLANSTNTGRVKLTTNWNNGKLSNEFLAGFSIIRDTRDPTSGFPLIVVNVSAPGSDPRWLSAGAERFSQSNRLDQDIYQVQDNLTFALDKHRLTVGTSNEFLKIRNLFLQASIGAYAFNSLDDLANNNPIAFQRRFGVSDLQEAGIAAFKVSQLGFYVQDEWLLIKNLTITPGIRFDVPILSKANANPALLTSPFSIDTSKVPSGNILWSPRLGLNWDVDGSANTIVRGGAGVFTGRPPYVWVSNAYTVNGLSQVELRCPMTAGGPVPQFNPDPNNQPSDCLGGTAAPSAPRNQGEIDYFDPNTKYPQNMRLALGVDRRLPWGMIATADLLYTQDINGWYTTDENLNYLGTNGEGRAMYGTFETTPPPAGYKPSRIDGTDLGAAVKVFNKNGGKVYSATLQLQKDFGRRYGVSVAYTYSHSEDLISFTSSQAFSNFQFTPLDGDIQNRNARPSAFDRPHKITVSGTAALPYGFGLGLTYVGQSGLPYTYTVQGDVNGDGVNGNDLVFVPANPSQISLSGSPAEQADQYAALQSFVDSQDCLREAKGRFIRRGACRNPWQSFVNLRLAWTSPSVKDQRLEVQFDIFNLMNLLNSKWGHLDQAANFENFAPSPFRSVGYDAAANRPIYTFTPPASGVVTTVYSPTQSRWRMQLGARYIF